MLARVARRDEKKPLVLVLLVEKRLVAVSVVAEAFPRVVCPITFAVPLTERLVVEALLKVV